MNGTEVPVTLTLLLAGKEPFPPGKSMFCRVMNDADVNSSFTHPAPTVTMNMQCHDGPGDQYRIVVNVAGYVNGGAFVHVKKNTPQTLDILMIPNHAKFAFPPWAELKDRFAATAKLIAGGVDDKTAEARYEALGKEKPLSLASLMNLSAAMEQLELGGGKNPMDFIKEVIWDDTLAQDRFFGYADPGILPLVQAAAADDEFARESGCKFFHKGSTCSYKQVQFDYSNVQLTFHEETKKVIDGVECIKIEPDMDLYKEIVAHGLGEVVPNLSSGGLTNPLDVLALRFIDTGQGEDPPFDPGYSLS